MWKWIVAVALIIVLIVLLNPPYRMVQSGEDAYIYNTYTGRVWYVYGELVWTTDYRKSEEWESVWLYDEHGNISGSEWQKKPE